jgi:DNA-binding transcriptional ArsR family regulator
MGSTRTHTRQGQQGERSRNRVRRGARLSDQAVELVAFRLRLFADPTRIRLLELLDEGEASVQELSDQLGTTYQNVSRHLNVLYQAGVLSRRKVGSSVRYALADWTGWWLVEQVSGTLIDRLDGLRAAFDTEREER